MEMIQLKYMLQALAVCVETRFLGFEIKHGKEGLWQLYVVMCLCQPEV